MRDSNYYCYLILDRVVPLGVDHFNQNGNIKSISHIDADAGNDNEYGDSSTQKPPIHESVNDKLDIELAVKDPKIAEKKDTEKPDDSSEDDGYSLLKYPKHKSIWHQIMWIIIWPTQLLFVLTIPNCETKRFKNLFPFTFLMCIIWIGSLSYLVAWMITIVGKYYDYFL